jgi:3-hydroxybutyryl-CoA dehydratase
MNNAGFRNKPLSLDQIKIGDKASFDVIIDEDLHQAFSAISGDCSPIHMSEKFSSQTKFGKRIGYAFLLTALLSRLYGEYLPGGSSVCIKQESKFIKPYHIGDKITVIGEVVEIGTATGFVEINTKMLSNDSVCIFKGKGLVQVAFGKELFDGVV